MADQKSLIPFLYQDEFLVRAFPGADGQPWFVAADVCRVLGLRRTWNALQGLDDDEKGTTNVSTLGGAQELLTVCEAGVYTLIIRSRRPEAAPFRRWVTHEVLPAIRRTGSYQRGQRQQKNGVQQWTDQRNAACRMIDAVRRTQGVRAAAQVAATILGELGYAFTDNGPDQGSLDLKVVGGTEAR
jgi:prophage antirepressor-like protein